MTHCAAVIRRKACLLSLHHTITAPLPTIMTGSCDWCRPRHFAALGDVNVCTEADCDINILCLALMSGLQTQSPGHPARWLCSLVASLVASGESTRAEMTIPAGWLRNGKARLSMWARCYAFCCPLGRNIWMKWHQLEGFPLKCVLICHLGMIEQRPSPKGRQISITVLCNMTWLRLGFDVCCLYELPCPPNIH